MDNGILSISYIVIIYYFKSFKNVIIIKNLYYNIYLPGTFQKIERLVESLVANTNREAQPTREQYVGLGEIALPGGYKVP